MKGFLDNIRYEKNGIPIWKKVIATGLILVFGFVLGIFSKYLDHVQAQAPFLLGIIDEKLDLHNFLGGFAPWLLIAVCISVYSKSSIRAAINVFAFFIAMVSGYYLYCNYVAGFFPRNYAMIWYGFTIVSPVLAFICWYAKGEGKAAIAISAGIIAILMRLAIHYGIFYINIS